MFKILIAEDDQASRVYLKNILSKFGECDLAINGIEALDIYFAAVKEKKPYDLIVLDIMMPFVDGIKVYKTIREDEDKRLIPDDSRVKILIASALTDTTNLFDGASKNEIYLVKPLKVEQIIEAAHKLGF